MTEAAASETEDEVEVAEEAPPVPVLTEPAEGTPDVVETPQALDQAIRALAAGTGPIAMDAERAGGYRYGQRAYLIQLKREGAGISLIDPIAFHNLSPLAPAIAGSEWVLHAASQDLACLADVGLVPTQLFDTELAARLLNRPRVGLAALAESELGIGLAKEHSAVDWSQRPLPEPWLRYAALDVEVLVQIRDLLAADLDQTGRREWAEQEFEHVRLAPARAARPDPWRRTSGIHKMKGARQLATVRELWQARDRVAQQRDTAPGRVLPDSAICAAAAAAPKSAKQLLEVRGFNGRGAKRFSTDWWGAIERAQAMPDDLLPRPTGPSDGPPPPRSWPDRNPVAAARLGASRTALAELAEVTDIPQENLLAPDVVRRLCWQTLEQTDPASISEALAELGARPWQIEFCAQPLSEAHQVAME